MDGFTPLPILTNSKEKSICVASDFHYPKICEKAVSRLEDCLKDEQPDIFIIAGDLIDAESISKYPILPTDRTRLREEVDGAKLLLKEFRKIIPRSKILYIFGNHEFRVKQYLIRQAPEFWEFVKLEDLLGLKELGVDFVDTRKNAVKFLDTYARIDNWLIGHFDKCLTEPGTTSKWLMEKRFPQYSVIQGHTHKTGMNVRKNLDGSLRWGIEMGCMCDTRSGFSNDLNWVNSFLEVKNGIPNLTYC